MIMYTSYKPFSNFRNDPSVQETEIKTPRFARVTLKTGEYMSFWHSWKAPADLDVIQVITLRS